MADKGRRTAYSSTDVGLTPERLPTCVILYRQRLPPDKGVVVLLHLVVARPGCVQGRGERAPCQ